MIRVVRQHPGPALVLLGVLLVAGNLRLAVTSLGSLLEEVSTGLGLDGTLAGVVTMLPALSFAGFGLATPWLSRRFRPAAILVVAMLVLAAGQAARAVTSDTLVFMATTAGAMSGIAVANVLLPSVVKQYFPHRVGLITGSYTVVLTSGTAVGAAAAVPIAEVAGSWRLGLGIWALLAAVAALPWLLVLLRRKDLGGASASADGSRPDPPARYRPARTGLGWAMAIYFGSQAMNGYAIMGWLAQLFRDAGFAPATAGLLLAGVTVLGIPVVLLIPTLAARLPDLRPVVLGLAAASGTAYIGLAVSPASPAWLWMALLALGQAAFPFALLMIGLRTRTAAGTVALSAFAQSTGYLIAGLGPLGVGVLYQLTSGWTAPLGFLLVVIAVQATVGLALARPRYLEDEAPFSDRHRNPAAV